MTRTRTGKQIKSTMTTNSTNPFSRRMKRLKQKIRTAPLYLQNELRLTRLSTLHIKVPSNSTQVFYSVYFTLITLSPFSRTYCTFIAISVTPFFH